MIRDIFKPENKRIKKKFNLDQYENDDLIRSPYYSNKLKKHFSKTKFLGDNVNDNNHFVPSLDYNVINCFNLIPKSFQFSTLDISQVVALSFNGDFNVNNDVTVQLKATINSLYNWANAPLKKSTRFFVMSFVDSTINFFQGYDGKWGNCLIMPLTDYDDTPTTRYKPITPISSIIQDLEYNKFSFVTCAGPNPWNNSYSNYDDGSFVIGYIVDKGSTSQLPQPGYAKVFNTCNEPKPLTLDTTNIIKLEPGLIPQHLNFTSMTYVDPYGGNIIPHAYNTKDLQNNTDLIKEIQNTYSNNLIDQLTSTKILVIQFPFPIFIESMDSNSPPNSPTCNALIIPLTDDSNNPLDGFSKNIIDDLENGYFVQGSCMGNNIFNTKYISSDVQILYFTTTPENKQYLICDGSNLMDQTNCNSTVNTTINYHPRIINKGSGPGPNPPGPPNPKPKYKYQIMFEFIAFIIIILLLINLISK